MTAVETVQGTRAPEELPNAESLLQLYGLGAARAHRRKALAIVLELAAAALSLSVFTDRAGSAALIASAAFAVAAGGLHFLHARYYDAARSARRQALIAHASGVDATGHAVTEVEVDILSRVSDSKRVLQRALLPPLRQYFATVRPVGVERLRECYATNAFFVSRVLRTYGNWLLGGVIVAVSGAFGVLQWLLSSGSEGSHVLELTYVLLLGFLLPKLTAGAASTFRRARTIEIFETTLFSGNLRSTEDIDHVGVLYEMTRAVGPDAPHWMYRSRKSELERQWNARRDSLP